MTKMFIVLMMAIFLSGCGIFETRVEYRDKLVPVYTVPEPPKITRPELPIHSERYSNMLFLSDPANIGQIVQDYTISLRLMLNYAQALEEIVKTYKDLSQRDFTNQPNTFSATNPNADVSLDSREELKYRALIAFSDIEDRYEERMEEIINDETQ